MNETSDYEDFSNQDRCVCFVVSCVWCFFFSARDFRFYLLPTVLNCLPLLCRRRWILANSASQTLMSPFIFEGLPLTFLPLTGVSLILLEIFRWNQVEIIFGGEPLFLHETSIWQVVLSFNLDPIGCLWTITEVFAYF